MIDHLTCVWIAIIKTRQMTAIGKGVKNSIPSYAMGLRLKIIVVIVTSSTEFLELRNDVQNTESL